MNRRMCLALWFLMYQSLLKLGSCKCGNVMHYRFAGIECKER